MKTIFPAAVIEQSSEYYQRKIAVRTKIIYLGTLAFLSLTLLSLPFIQVDLSVQARGTFQSALERNEVFVPVSGRVHHIQFRENDKVQKGDLLAEIEAAQLDLELQGYEQRIGLLQDFLVDLKRLNSINLPLEALGLPGSFRSDVYAAAYYEFSFGYENLKANLDKITRDFERNKLLYQSKVISFTEFDEAKLKYEQAVYSLELHIKKQKAQWKQQASNYANELQQLENKVRLVNDQKTHYKIIAGVSGTLMNVKNIKEGDYVFSNQKIGEISPDTTLLAIVYVAPKDVGFIKPGQPVSFQVDAFNYNDWGLAKGKVMEIGDDLSLVDQLQVAFRGVCSLDQTQLTLKNGYKGQLKKGMTFNGRFQVARRSLFQLLFDKVDDWINPTTSQV